MTTTISGISSKKLYQNLNGGCPIIVMKTLNELDSRMPSKSEAEVINAAFEAEKNPILKFELKRSLRLAAGKLKNLSLKVNSNIIAKLMSDTSRLEDLALALVSLDTAGGVLSSEQIRSSSWQKYPAEILPTFCFFFKKYGGFEDLDVLSDLAWHPNSIVASAAIDAIEAIAPVKLQGIIEPLLESKEPGIKAQSIQIYYKWNHEDGLKRFISMLMSDDPATRYAALFQSKFMPYGCLEPYLLKLLPIINDPIEYMCVAELFIINAHPQLPLRLFLINQKLQGNKQVMTKGILLGIIRQLNKNGAIKISIQSYLSALKQKAFELAQNAQKRDTEEAASQPSESNKADLIAESSISSNETISYNDLVKHTIKSSNEETDSNSELKDESISKSDSPEIEQSTNTQNNIQPSQNSVSEAKEAPLVNKKIAENISSEDSEEPDFESEELNDNNPESQEDENTPFESLSQKKQIQTLAKADNLFFESNYSILANMLTNSSGKLQAAVINFFGKFSNGEETQTIKDLCRSDDIDIICACIKALATLDVEYLCLYMPQFLQHKNGKVRMTAARILAKIDEQKIVVMLSSLISNPNNRQRSIGISSSMLVEFSLVKTPLLSALEKETNPELIEKIAGVLASNPDQEILDRVFGIAKRTIDLKSQLSNAVHIIAEKLSVLLNHSQSPEDLISVSEENYKKALKVMREERIKSMQASIKMTEAAINLNNKKGSTTSASTNSHGLYENSLKKSNQKQSSILEDDQNKNDIKHTLAISLLFTGMAFFGVVLALLILKLFFGIDVISEMM